MFNTGRRTATVFESDVVEFVQNLIGGGETVANNISCNVYMGGKRIGSVVIEKIDCVASRLTEEMNESFFGKFNRVLKAAGNNIYVSELLV